MNNSAPKECSPEYNLSELREDPRLVRVCMMQQETRKKILEKKAESLGKNASHGVCEAHEEDFKNYSYGRV